MAKSDLQLLQAFLQIPSHQARAVFISNLDESALQALCNRLSNFVKQRPGYKLSEENKTKVKTALEPHKKIIKRLISSGKKRPYVVRKQRGGAIVSLILGAVIPIIADLVYRGIKKAVK